MTGRDFVNTADHLSTRTAESDWRSAVSRAYYAVYLECREAMRRWGLTISVRGSHRDVGQRLSAPANADLNLIARTFDHLASLRNKADYELATIPAFASAVKAKAAVSDARKAIALLDALEADPARLKQAIDDIRKAFP